LAIDQPGATTEQGGQDATAGGAGADAYGAPGWIAGAEQGLHLCLRLPPQVDDRALAALAARHNLTVRIRGGLRVYIPYKAL
jgi:hypothetical protein